MVTLAGRVLASACAMELHSALERAQSQLRTQQVVGLVEEVGRLPVVQQNQSSHSASPVNIDRMCLTGFVMTHRSVAH